MFNETYHSSSLEARQVKKMSNVQPLCQFIPIQASPPLSSPEERSASDFFIESRDNSSAEGYRYLFFSM